MKMFKKSFILGLVMGLLLSSELTFGAVGDNVVINGNLDTLAGWGGWGPSAATTPIGKIELNTTGYQGNCGRVVTSAAGYWFISQVVNTVPLADYDLSCWIKSTTPLEIIAVWDNTPNGWQGKTLTNEVAAVSIWKNYSLTFKALSNMTNLLFQITNATGTLDVDNVTCVQKTLPDGYVTSLITLIGDATKLEIEKQEAYLHLGINEFYRGNYTGAVGYFSKILNETNKNRALFNTYMKSAKVKMGAKKYTDVKDNAGNVIETGALSDAEEANNKYAVTQEEQKASLELMTKINATIKTLQ